MRTNYILILIIGILISPLTSGAQNNSLAPRPNIIIVLVDDMGYGHIGANYEKYNESNVNADLLQRARSQNDSYSLEEAVLAARYSTPTLQKLVSEGVRFTDAHVANSLCAPSRAAILTGLSPQRFGIYNNEDMNAHGVPENIQMLPKLFQENGYATACIGKWHVGRYDKERLGFAYDGQHPNDRGFDYYFGFNNSGTQYYDSKILYRNKEKASAEGYLTDQFTKEARTFIKKESAKPFFLYLAYNTPHGPLNQLAPQVYDSRFKDLPRTLRIWNSYMYAVDEGIKSILETLKETGDINNTLIYFLSDNGASGGTPLPANGYNRGYKGTLYAGGTRTGMMAWWPGQIPPASVCDAMISSMDVIPTCLDAAGISIPKNLQLDGKSMLPLITQTNNNPTHKYLVWANKNDLSWAYPRVQSRDVPAAWTVKDASWILHYWSDSDNYTLYNYENDMGEKKDVFKQNPRVVERLKNYYAEWFDHVIPSLSWGKEVWLGLKPAERLTPEETRILSEERKK